MQVGIGKWDWLESFRPILAICLVWLGITCFQDTSWKNLGHIEEYFARYISFGKNGLSRVCFWGKSGPFNAHCEFYVLHRDLRYLEELIISFMKVLKK